MSRLTLVLGGARSGKSRFAESLARQHGGPTHWRHQRWLGSLLRQLSPDAMREHVLARACAFLAMDHGLLQEWDAEGVAYTSARHGNPARLGSLAALADRSLRTPCWQERPSEDLPSVLQVPLRAGDGDAFGVLVLGNSVSLRAPEHEDSESLQLLATLLAAHLENQGDQSGAQRLYRRAQEGGKST